MQVFINESSLHSQYHSIKEYHDALKDVINSLNILQAVKISQVHNATCLYYMYGFSTTNLSTVLKNNTDLSLRFKDAIQKNNIKPWERIHQYDIPYLFNEVDYNGCSIAEFAERKLVDTTIKGFLLNFSNSIFNSFPTIQVIKGQTANVSLTCINDSSLILDWLVENGYINESIPYDISSSLPPTDSQTVLNDSANFESTTYPKNNGRKVYRRKNTSQLWVVDGSIRHANSKAHIEVFDEGTKNHIGTSLYNVVNLDVNHMKDNRKIDLG